MINLRGNYSSDSNGKLIFGGLERNQWGVRFFFCDEIVAMPITTPTADARVKKILPDKLRNVRWIESAFKIRTEA